MLVEAIARGLARLNRQVKSTSATTALDNSRYARVVVVICSATNWFPPCE